MIYEKLEKLVLNAVSESFPEVCEFGLLIETPKDRVHGDYSTSIALKIAKEIKESPMAIAKKITERIKIIEEIEKTEILEPGFINFFLSKKIIKKELVKILQEKEKYGSNGSGTGKTIIIDYSSPNIAKSFGIGHLRSTIIGQAIYNIYQFQGWKCIGDNHLGDWGTQFGKLIYQIKEKKLKGKKDKEKILKSLTIKDLEKLYVDFHKESEKNPKLESEGRECFKKLESGDNEAQEIWEFCVKVSIEEFNRIYGILGIKIDNAFGESFYSEMTNEVIMEMKEKKVAKESEKALVVDFSDKLPVIIAVKSDGATTYLVRDLATIKYRIKTWDPCLFVYEVGADQLLYFKQLFETAKLLGWTKEKNFIHIAHGLVRWKHGKFSTRKGDTIHLEEILQEAIQKALKIIEESDVSKNISSQEKQEIAQKVGIGAVKYNDLSQHYLKDIIFDWEKILNLKGNSGPYIQYTFARCMSVLKKGNFFLSDFIIEQTEKEEENILRTIIKFPSIVNESEKLLSPNIICLFLFELAQQYNVFYNNHQILEENKDKRQFRLSLTAAVAQIIKNGLDLLGIETPEKM